MYILLLVKLSDAVRARTIFFLPKEGQVINICEKKQKVLHVVSRYGRVLSNKAAIIAEVKAMPDVAENGEEKRLGGILIELTEKRIGDLKGRVRRQHDYWLNGTDRRPAKEFEVTAYKATDAFEMAEKWLKIITGDHKAVIAWLGEGSKVLDFVTYPWGPCQGCEVKNTKDHSHRVRAIRPRLVGGQTRIFNLCGDCFVEQKEEEQKVAERYRKAMGGEIKPAKKPAITLKQSRDGVYVEVRLTGTTPLVAPTILDHYQQQAEAEGQTIVLWEDAAFDYKRAAEGSGKWMVGSTTFLVEGTYVVAVEMAAEKVPA